MKYRNKVTKAVIETNGIISGDNWVEVKRRGKAPDPVNSNEESPGNQNSSEETSETEGKDDE